MKESVESALAERAMIAELALSVLSPEETALYEAYMAEYGRCQRALADYLGGIENIARDADDRLAEEVRREFPGVVDVLERLSEIEDQMILTKGQG